MNLPFLIKKKNILKLVFMILSRIFYFDYVESLPETGYKIKQNLYSQRSLRSQTERRYFNDATFYAKIINLFSFN